MKVITYLKHTNCVLVQQVRGVRGVCNAYDIILCEFPFMAMSFAFSRYVHNASGDGREVRNT